MVMAIFAESISLLEFGILKTKAMKTEEIKQMAEAKALLKYPVNTNWSSHNGTIDFNESKREAYAQAIIDNYKEQERV